MRVVESEDVILRFAKFLGAQVSMDQTYNQMVQSNMKKTGCTVDEAERRADETIAAAVEPYLVKVLGPRR